MNKNENSESEKNNTISKGKDKNKDIPKDKTLLKNYKVPDAINKKYFDKINTYNFIGIMKFFSFPEMLEISFVNKKFLNIIEQKYPKRIPLIKITLKTLKKNIFFNFSEDFRFQLRKNSSHTSSITKAMIESLLIEYFPKMKVKKYYFSHMKSNPEVKELFLGNSDIGKKSMKYLSYYFNNKNCNITDIDISGNKISGEILKPLCHNPNIILNNLIANKCIVDLKTFTFLSDIKTKKLSLVNNSIDNEYISKLQNNYINELNISFNSLSNESIFNICKNLPNLTKLNISNNNICDLSIVYICLYMKEQKNKLTSLNLKDNKITITGMLTLISTLDKINKTNNNNHSLSKLNLSGNLLDLLPIPKRLETYFSNVRIEKLCLGNHSFNITDLNILLNFINNIKNITVLDLSKIVFDNVSLNLIFNRVSENNSLKKLKLKYCYLGNTEVNNTLENYYLKNGSQKKSMKNKHINRNIGKNGKEEDLKLVIKEEKEEKKEKEEIKEKEEKKGKDEKEKKEKEGNEEKEKNKEELREKEEKKEKKEKESNNINGIEIDKKKKEINNKNNNNNLSEFIGVESLDLGYNFINYQKLDTIIISNRIKELNIEGNDLHLWGNNLNVFFDFIIKNKVLEKLNLNRNNLQKSAKIFLEKMNNFNSDPNSADCALKFLSLEENQIKDINLELTNLLSNNKNLEVLNLRKNLIDDEIANNYFFHSLFKHKNSNIKNINISHNKISLAFIEKIIKYSKENAIEKNNFVLNITSKEIREAYLNIENKEPYKELVNLKNIKCF